jgi:hypothetical protein
LLVFDLDAAFVISRICPTASFNFLYLLATFAIFHIDLPLLAIICHYLVPSLNDIFFFIENTSFQRHTFQLYDIPRGMKLTLSSWWIPRKIWIKWRCADRFIVSATVLLIADRVDVKRMLEQNFWELVLVKIITLIIYSAADMRNRTTNAIYVYLNKQEEKNQGRGILPKNWNGELRQESRSEFEVYTRTRSFGRTLYVTLILR